MTRTNKKSIPKAKLLALIKDLDWQSLKAALDENPELLAYRGRKGENLLHVCCGIDVEKHGLRAADSVATARALLDASCDINEEAFKEGEWRATPLWYAIAHGRNLKLAEYLLARGADPEHCMWAAAYNESPAAIRLLVRAGAQVEGRGGETPFLFAVKWSRFESAKALLESGANVNVQDRRGKSALHYMLKKRSDPKYVRMLLKHGARLDLKDHDGVTAGNLLARMRSPEYRNLLKKRP